LQLSDLVTTDLLFAQVLEKPPQQLNSCPAPDKSICAIGADEYRPLAFVILFSSCNLAAVNKIYRQAGLTESNSPTAQMLGRYLQPVRHTDFKLPIRNLLYFDTLTLTTQYKNLL